MMRWLALLSMTALAACGSGSPNISSVLFFGVAVKAK